MLERIINKVSIITGLGKSEPNFMSTLKEFEELRFPLAPYNESHNLARDFIKRTFHSFGLHVDTQNFTSKIAAFDNSVVEVSRFHVLNYDVHLN